MKLSAFAVILATCLLNLYLWEFSNKPVELDGSTYPVASISLNPYQRYQDPFGGHTPTLEDMTQDVALLAGKTKAIRLYSAREGLDKVAGLAAKHGIAITGGAWLDHRLENNRLELEALVAMAGKHKNVQRVLVGNETQLHGSVPYELLVSYLDEARRRLKIPVATAEPWDYWLEHPELAKHVDYIAVHILPYWVDVPVQNGNGESAVDYVIKRYEAVKRAFPKKHVVITETGWPSEGKQRGDAEASVANQALFIREFIARAKAMKIDYNIIEAFDQPWKTATEGQVGGHWGLMDAERQNKFPLSGPVLNDPLWRQWALSSTIIGLFAMIVFLFRRSSLKLRGQIFSAVVLQGAAVLMTVVAREAAGQYMTSTDIAFWTVMCGAQALLAVILLTDAAEITDVVGGKPLKRKFEPLPPNSYTHYPFVSLHLACCKEPPEMVIATIDSLAKLDYPNFEVIVVDNNTPDEALWRPVEARCKELGFRFFSLGSWPGYKAGALNFALKHTDARAEVVGVVDADYIVESNWLAAAVPYFSDSAVGVVQAPQEHRGWENNLFQRMESDEYSGFFRIGMVQRNEDDAIIQHGTMTLIRRSTMDRLGGWAEWCICEDAELGLRVLISGQKTIYIDHAFGRGLTPDSYEAYAKQRFRWAYGGMRIMRRHWKELLGLKPGLNAAQRYQFVKGWLPWIGDGLHMFFTFGALFWSAMLLIDPDRTDFPAAIFVYPALALVALRILGTAWTYATRVKIGMSRTVLAMVAGGALTHAVAKAVVQGLLTSGKPFYRTPKMAAGQPLLRSLLCAREELLLAAALYYCAYRIVDQPGVMSQDAKLWAAMLLTQSLPYIASVFASLVSSTEASRLERAAKRHSSTAVPALQKA